MRKFYIKDLNGETREVEEEYYKTVVNDMGLPTEDDVLPSYFIYPDKQTCGFFKEQEGTPRKIEEKPGNLTVTFDTANKCIVLSFPVPTSQYVLNMESTKILISILTGSLNQLERM